MHLSLGAACSWVKLTKQAIRKKTYNNFQEKQTDEVLFVSSPRQISLVLVSRNKSKEVHVWKKK